MAPSEGTEVGGVARSRHHASGRSAEPRSAGDEDRPGRVDRSDDGSGAAAVPARWPRWSRHPALAPVLALVPVLVVGAFVLARIGDDPLVGADYSLLQLGTRSVWRGDALVGPYSRFRWNHPGPALWYWFAPFYAGAGQRAGGLSLAAVALNGIGLGWCVAAIGRIAGRVAALTAAAVVLLWISQTGTSWLDQPWNPLMTIVALVVAAVATAGVAAGHRWHLVVAVGAASFAIQTHVGTAPMAGAFLAVVAVATAVQLRAGWRPWLGPAFSAVVAGGVLWALPIYEQLTREPGNLGLLVRYSRGPRGDHGLGEVFDVIGADLTLVHRDLISNLLAGGGDPPPAAQGWHLVAIVVLLLAAALATVANIRAGRRFTGALCGSALLGAAALVVSLMRLDDVLYPYLAVSAIALGLLLWLGIALTVVGEVGARVRPATAARATGPLAAALCLVALLVGGQAVTADHTAFPFARLVADEATVQGVATVVDATPAGGRVQVAMVDPSTWGPGSLVVNQLERAGRTVTVDERWEFMFGPERGPAGCPDALVTVRDIDPSRRAPEPLSTAPVAVTTTVGESIVTAGPAPPSARCPG